MKRMALAGVVFGMMGVSAPRAEPGDLPQYTIKQSSPGLGSHIKRPIIQAGSLPPDKRHAELSAEEKASLKAQYEHLGEGDEPPYPAEGQMAIFLSLRRAHEDSGLQHKGAVLAYVKVDPRGKPVSVSVSQSPDPDITEVLVTALMAQSYKPALCNGGACTMEFPFRAELTGPEERTITSMNRASGLSTRPPQ